MKKEIAGAIDLSAMVYQDWETIQGTLRRRGFQQIRWASIDDTGTEGVFCQCHNRAWIAIRGTELLDVDDWLTNFDTRKVTSLWGEVHAGFLAAAVSMMGKFSEYIEAALVSGKEVVFTGHSQGAAVSLQMGSIALYRWGDLYKNQIICIPIEAPRSFSSDAARLFGKYYGNRIYPVVNNNDIVWNVPPVVMGFSHVTGTNTQYIDRKGRVHQKITKRQKFFDKILGYISDIGKPGLDLLKDHDIERIRTLWANQP